MNSTLEIAEISHFFTKNIFTSVNTRERSVGSSQKNRAAPCFKQTGLLAHQVLPSYIAT